jgi:predicted O-methyltransferase YrrM
MEFINPDIQRYCEAHTSPESPVLQALNRTTHARVLMPRMLSGHLQGQLLAMYSNMMQPRRILEIGTYTGYSAICLAQGLQEGGKLITIDKNEELEDMMRDAWQSAGLQDKIELHLGNALDILPHLEGPFDMVFIDADKKNYLKYYHMVVPKMRLGGLIMADNVLWSGKIVNPDARDTDTRALREFNDFVMNDERVETLLLPVRDGIMMARICKLVS